MNFKSIKGFTLIETIIAIAIFTMVSVAVYSTYLNVLDLTIASQLNSTALTVIANELETIRNIEYQDIGVQGGAPAGIIPAQKNINFSGFNFILNVTIRNIDDPFDGVLGGVPNDIAPGDRRLVELTLSCSNCPRFIPITTTTTVGPANLEGSSKNGNLFINAIDASGEPVVGANVSMVNNSVNPTITINDVTNNSGQLQLVDIATSSLGYQITVSKSGYSTERTYLPGDVQNPNPVKPHATVVMQQVTAITFGIDQLSTQTFTTRNKFCQAVPAIDFIQQGAKFIGTDPDVLKYSVSDSTDANGNKTVNLEWDNYTIQNTDSGYDLSGTSLAVPFTVNPDSNFNINWMMEPRNQPAILVAAQTATGQLIDDATVTLTRTGFSQTRISGHSYFMQTDWSGGQFFQKSQNVEESSPAGELSIRQVGGKYASMSSEWLESQTFDMGTSANFHNLRWNPQSQSSETGADSLKFQIATNNDNGSWNYVGPDGTAATYYISPDSIIHAGHNGNRYLRYRVYLFTQDEDFTPKLEDVEIEFSSSCIPDGQSYFSGLTTGNYTLTVQGVGYQNYTAQININSGWQEHKATLIP